MGLDLFSIGQIEPADAGYEVVEKESDGGYFRFMFRDGCMVGAILLGDTALTAPVTGAIERRRDFSVVLRHRPSVGDVLTSLEEIE